VASHLPIHSAAGNFFLKTTAFKTTGNKYFPHANFAALVRGENVQAQLHVMNFLVPAVVLLFDIVATLACTIACFGA
jgi:hypothetical protein